MIGNQKHSKALKNVDSVGKAGLDLAQKILSGTAALPGASPGKTDTRSDDAPDDGKKTDGAEAFFQNRQRVPERGSFLKAPRKVMVQPLEIAAGALKKAPIDGSSSPEGSTDRSSADGAQQSPLGAVSSLAGSSSLELQSSAIGSSNPDSSAHPSPDSSSDLEFTAGQTPGPGQLAIRKDETPTHRHVKQLVADAPGKKRRVIDLGAAAGAGGGASGAADGDGSSAVGGIGGLGGGIGITTGKFAVAAGLSGLLQGFNAPGEKLEGTKSRIFDQVICNFYGFLRPLCTDSDCS